MPQNIQFQETKGITCISVIYHFSIFFHLESYLFALMMLEPGETCAFTSFIWCNVVSFDISIIDLFSHETCNCVQDYKVFMAQCTNGQKTDAEDFTH